MDVTLRQAKTILTAQITGFLASAPYPFTHSLSAYTGCGFGQTTCGLYCYAQFMPNWTNHHAGTAWGNAVAVKENAPELLETALRQMPAEKRQRLRIFMSSTTDPYQPIETSYGITRRCLEVFARFPDLDLLVIQTRGTLAARDFDLMARIPYAWLSVTIETDDQDVIRNLRGGPPLAKRFALIRDAAALGINTQIAVSPALPFSNDFGDTLATSGAARVIVDTCVEGDGSKGQRTARTAYARLNPAWRDEESPRELFIRLQLLSVNVGWSTAGFCGIPPRAAQPTLF